MDANHTHHCCCSSRRDGPQSPLVQPSPGPLTRSLPSTHSLASALSPGASTPGSWTAHPWSPGSSNTSPPSTRSGSPELKVRFQTEKVETAPRVDVTEVLPTVTKSVKSICFVGAGFVGMFAFVDWVGGRRLLTFDAQVDQLRPSLPTTTQISRSMLLILMSSELRHGTRANCLSTRMVC